MSLTGVSVLQGRVHRIKRLGSGCIEQVLLLKQFCGSCRLQVEGNVALFQSSKSEGNGLEVFSKACAEYDQYRRLHH